MFAIYALIDPRDNTVRYVGLTNDVYKRFNDHISCASANFPKNVWIIELRAANKMVIMETLEEVEGRDEAEEREAYWIKHFEQMKEPVMNISKTSKPRKSKRTNLRMAQTVSSEIVARIVEQTTVAHLASSIEEPVKPEKNETIEYRPCSILGPGDKQFTLKQDEEFLTRYRKKPQAIKNILRQMDGGNGLSNRYAKYASWLLKVTGEGR